jgi:hypothetical protein
MSTNSRDVLCDKHNPLLCAPVGRYSSHSNTDFHFLRTAIQRRGDGEEKRLYIDYITSMLWTLSGHLEGTA